MSRLALRLLGPPHIELDGLTVSLDRQKALALLAYLAVTGESHRRDALVNLLWPELDSTRGRAALRRTLFSLRQALADPWLDADREEIGLNADPDLWVDVAQFRSLLALRQMHGHPASHACSACISPLADAVALVRGEFLSGFSLKDSYNFDDWQLFEAERIRRELATALDALVDWHAAQREFEAAVAYARRRLALDPLHEPTHRQLMRLYVWSGQRSAALRQYDECMDLLQDQLSVSPQQETLDLQQAIQDGQAPSLPEASPVEAPGTAATQRVSEPPGALPQLEAAFPAFLEGQRLVERPLCVARERELAQLDRYLGVALAAQGKVVFVTGDVGSGKTALVHEFARRAQAAHPQLVFASGNCNAYTGLGDPYLPFREILELLTGDVEARWATGTITRDHARRLWDALPTTAQALVEVGLDLVDTFIPGTTLLKRAVASVPDGAPWLNTLGNLVEQKGSSGGGARSPHQSDLFEQYSRVIQALALRRPLLLLVDDLQWADLGSISLLFHLGRSLLGCPVLLLGAYRHEEVTIGRDGERHPLEPVLNELQRDFGDTTVNLAEAAGRDFIEAYLDSEPNRLAAPFRQMLYQQTRGHPLFTIELLRGMQERGDLVQDSEGCWVEGPALNWETLPARVEAVVAERIGRLAQPLRSALRVASVEGEVFTAEVVARVQDISESQLLACLSSELDRRHRLVRAQGILRLDPAPDSAKGGQRLSQYRFRHILFQKYLYSTLDEVERTLLHESVGNTLEALYEGQIASREAPAIQLAWHFQEAGIGGKAVDYLLQAGQRALQLSAYEEAIAHFSRGLSLLETLPESPQRARQELKLQMRLSVARTAHGIYWSDVGTTYNRARELAQQVGENAKLYLILGHLSIFHYVRSEYHTASRIAQEALRLAEEANDPLHVALGHWYLGMVLHCLGDHGAALAHFQQVTAFYDPNRHHRAFVSVRGSDGGLAAMGYLVCCLWCLGYPDQAAAMSQEALALARKLGHPWSLADVLCYAGCMFHQMRRDPHPLLDLATELARVAQEGITGWASDSLRYKGAALALLGQLEEGITLMREGMAANRTRGVRLHLPGTLGFVAEAQAKAGRPSEALVALDEAFTIVEETDERIWEPELHRLRAEILLLEGDEAGAEASLRKALDVAGRQNAKSWELRAATSLAQLWAAQGKPDQARQLLSGVYDWFTEGFDTPDLIQAQTLLQSLS